EGREGPADLGGVGLEVADDAAVPLRERDVAVDAGEVDVRVQVPHARLGLRHDQGRGRAVGAPLHEEVPLVLGEPGRGGGVGRRRGQALGGDGGADLLGELDVQRGGGALVRHCLCLLWLSGEIPGRGGSAFPPLEGQWARLWYGSARPCFII